MSQDSHPTDEHDPEQSDQVEAEPEGPPPPPEPSPESSEPLKSLYPLAFHPILKPKVWGGVRLGRLGKPLPTKLDGSPEKIGESWELADLYETSISGGGGGEEHSVVANGHLAGRSINQVVRDYGRALLGRLPLTGDGGLPILIKFLDAHENLSVQVHPSAEYAAEHSDAHLKSEAWYIVEADPGAAIYKGVKPGVTPEQFRKAALDGTLEPLLIKVPVKAGDCHYLPSGTCHALGGGILVAEVQTPSDTTFRVYDWGRTDRQLHLEQALACIEFGPPDTARYERKTHIAGIFTTVTRLVECEHFRIEKIRMSEGYAQEIPYSQPAVWIVLEGAGRIIPSADSEPVEFAPGMTMLIPAEMHHAKAEFSADTVWLEVTFPQAVGDVLA
ncbi:MAG: class I mannose-6-phosphate isomerase [Phycisphaeraceae bacterium]|nr:class I mannose-6-phosphate isomerase [Phycisphaeraceae bacterium]